MLFRSFQIAGTMIGDAKVYTWRTQFRCRVGNELKQCYALVESTLLEKCQRLVVIQASIGTDSCLLGYREAKLLLDFDTRRCACGSGRCTCRQQ